MESGQFEISTKGPEQILKVSRGKIAEVVAEILAAKVNAIAQ
jgi:hypothetical protein